MNQHDHISGADQDLADQLDALGSAARQHGQLVERTISASSSLLPAPTPLPIANVGIGSFWGRMAVAASILLTLAVFARLLSDSESGETPLDRTLAVNPEATSGSEPLEFHFEHSDRDTVLLTLLEANSIDEIVLVDEFDRTDDFGDAFAPILGTTGLGFDDFSLEIDSIRSEFNSGLRR